MDSPQTPAPASAVAPALDTFLASVTQLTQANESGSEEERLVARMYTAIALADLIAPTESEEYRANLVLIFMRDPPLEQTQQPEQPAVQPYEIEEPQEPYDEIPVAELLEIQDDFMRWSAGEIDDDGNSIADE
jgi:hypothetical protein